MKLLEALGNLDLQPEWFASNGRRVNGSDECRTLLKVTSKLRERDSQIQSEPPLDPDAVWNLWSRNNFNIEVLDARQIRTLCLSAVTAVRPQFVRACNGQPAILSRTSCLLGMINAYFLEWGDIQDQSEVESLIRGGLSRYAKKNPVILHFRHHSDQLFSSRGPTSMANSAIDGLKPIRETIKQNHISANSKFARAILSSAIRTFAAYFARRERRADDGECNEALSYAIRELLVDESPREEFCALTEAFILTERAERSEQFRSNLRTFVMAHEKLGDPRLPRNAANWAMLRQEAASRFLSWLARDSIIFFFNYILPSNDKNRRRKDFWLQYYQRVRDF